MKIRKGYVISALLVVVALVTALMGTAMAVMAVPVAHACSQNIAMVPYSSAMSNPYQCINGGTLPSTGWPATTPSGATFAPVFTRVNPEVISDPLQADPIAAGGYDTVVLNAIYPPFLTPTLFSRLETFVRGGGKLIIYTSEQTSGNWSGFIRPFNSSNPGAAGANGTLTIVEENTLSKTAPADPYYINAGLISTGSDAVGDANVFTTFDPNWCVDMRAINVLGVNGPVHTYSHLDYGLIIYNGLDIDYMNSAYSGVTPTTAADYLEKIYGLELMQPWYPTGLPCGTPAFGQLSLLPVQDSNPTNTQHCVTATLVNGAGAPVVGATVTFTVTGVNPTSGQGTTNGSGQATFCYTGTVEGLDKIVATCADPGGTGTLTSNDAFKDWTPGGPVIPPVEVGGDVYPANTLVILTPWLVLAIVIAVGTTILIRRRQNQS